MQTLHETNNYAFNYDARMGVGNFERKADGLQSDLETGSDCEELRESLDKLFANPHSNTDTVFDCKAEQYTFSY